MESASRTRCGNPRDLMAGLAFMAVGAAIAMKARAYNIGTPSNSGAGFFPFYLGLILAGIGLIVAVIAILDRRSAREAMGFHPRAFLWVLGPVILFGAMLMQGGLVLSAFVAVLLSSFASRQFRWRGALLNAVVLAIIVLGAFAYALRIQIPVWPAMIVEGMRQT